MMVPPPLSPASVAARASPAATRTAQESIERGRGPQATRSHPTAARAPDGPFARLADVEVKAARQGCSGPQGPWYPRIGRDGRNAGRAVPSARAGSDDNRLERLLGLLPGKD